VPTMGGPILTIYISYNVLAQGVAFFTVAIIAPALKILVALMFCNYGHLTALLRIIMYHTNLSKSLTTFLLVK